MREIGKTLELQMARKRRSRFDKRILVSYLQICPDHQLDSFYLGFEGGLEKILADKYMLYLYNVFLNRDYEPAVSNLVSSTLADPDSMFSLMGMTNFRYLLSRNRRSDNPRLSSIVCQLINIIGNSVDSIQDSQRKFVMLGCLKDVVI